MKYYLIRKFFHWLIAIMFFPLAYLFIIFSEKIGLKDSIKDFVIVFGVFFYVGFSLFLVDRIKKYNWHDYYEHREEENDSDIDDID